MGTITALQPYTQWNLLDRLILQLAIEGDNICRNRISKDRFYNTLVDIVCTPNPVDLVRGIAITKPLYPYILISYYLLFYRKDLATAVQLIKNMLEISRSSKAVLDNNEEIAMHTLVKVVEELYALKSQGRNKYRGILGKVLVLLVSKLEQSPLSLEGDSLESSTCSHYRDEWGCIFKELVEAYLDLDLVKSLKKLRRIKEIVERKLQSYEELDEEIVEGYNLFTDTASSPIYTFLDKIAENEIKKLENKQKEIEKLADTKQRIEKKYNTVIEWQKKLRIYIENIRNLNDFVALWPVLISFLASLIAYYKMPNAKAWLCMLVPIAPYVLRLISWYYGRKLKKINDEIQKATEFKVEEIAGIIWSS